MADTKISGLPASTTPLAGTEVLPIVQSGVTTQVSVANLTAGRDVSANIFSSAAGAVATPSITTAGDTNTGIWFPAADTIAASTAGTERMRISSDGNIGIGASSVGFARINLEGTATQLFGLSYGIRNATSIANASVSTYIGVNSEPTTQAAAWTLGNLIHYAASPQAFGAGSTVTNQYGFRADSSLTGATNNFGFYSDIASGTGRYNFYAGGTAANYFAGNVGIGTTTMSQVFNVTAANASGFVGQRIQNYNGGSGLAGVEFSSDSTYSKSAIAQLRTSPNGAGPLVFYVDSNTDAANWASGDEKMRIAINGAISLGGTSGSQSLSVTPVTSSVNYWDFYGSATGSDPYVFPSGSDTNRGFIYLTKGTGTHQFMTGSGLSNTQFKIANTASAVNYLQVQGGSTGNAPILLSTGSDANVNFTMQTKGTGSYYIYGAGAYFYNNSSAPQFAVASTASAVNYLQVTGAATGNATTLSAQGSDTNIDLALTPKGTGVLKYGTYTAGILAQAGYITIKDAGGTTRNLLVG